MFVKSTGRISATNAAFNVMNAQNSMLNLVSFAGGMNPLALHNSETQLNQSIIQNSLRYKLGLIQEETQKEIENENIKRTFSTFA